MWRMNSLECAPLGALFQAGLAPTLRGSLPEILSSRFLTRIRRPCISFELGTQELRFEACGKETISFSAFPLHVSRHLRVSRAKS